MTNRTFKDWYDEKKDAHNRARRKKYAEDPAYRKKSAAQCKKYRSTVKDADKGARTKTFIVGGKTVVGHTVRRVAQLAGVSIQSLLPLERKGAIPKHTLPSAQRYYTDHQIDLLVKYFKGKSPNFSTWE